MRNKEELEKTLAVFSQRLLLRLEEKQLTQAALAKKAGVAQSTVSKWLSPETHAQPNLPQLLKLATVLDVSVDWLLGSDASISATYNRSIRALCAMADRISDTSGITDEYLRYLFSCYKAFVSAGVSESDILIWQAKVDEDFEIELLPWRLCSKNVYEAYLNDCPDLRATDEYTQHLRVLRALHQDLISEDPRVPINQWFDDEVCYAYDPDDYDPNDEPRLEFS
ncbi:MAG: helix-turn-helix transcriptional regulator [Butyrivibrio sp.]|nr:helix-turn-helix transcriptional regulator [Butyrivibrio sp.]